MDTVLGSQGRDTKRTDNAAGATGRLAATVNNKSVKVINGELVAIPFATSKSSVPKQSVSSQYGAINTILNPPNADRMSTYNAHYNETSRLMQTAGTVNKRPVPYHPNAFRNRLKAEEPKKDPPTVSHIKFEAGIANKSTHPYRTIKSAMEAPTVKPMHTHRGFTNGFITAEMTKRWHKQVWAQ